MKRIAAVMVAAGIMGCAGEKAPADARPPASADAAPRAEAPAQPADTMRAAAPQRPAATQPSAPAGAPAGAPAAAPAQAKKPEEPLRDSGAGPKFQVDEKGKVTPVKKP